MTEPVEEKPRRRSKAAPILDAMAETPEEGSSRGAPPMTQLMQQLGALRQAVTYLVEYTEEQKAIPEMLTEYRDTLVEACTVWESQGREMSSLLDRIHQCVAQAQRPTPTWRWLSTLGSGLIGALIVGACWFWWPSPPLAQLGASLNQAIVQQYAQLPRPVQESLTVAYKRTGFQAPLDQLKGGK